MTYRIDATPPLVYLAEGASEINSVIDVSVSDTAGRAGPVAATEVLVIDCSGSMHGGKIAEARVATAAAVDCVRNGVHFAVIAGTERATQVYPRSGLAVAEPAVRAAAKRAVARLRASGGTAIGTWLRAAGELFRTRPGTVRHAILLTDGQDVGEAPADLQAAIDAVTGLFQCDCRGVGVDWEVAELRKITSALLGEVGIVAEPADLTADFERLVSAAMGKTTPELRLRVWTPDRASIRSLRQVHPWVEDLTAKRIEISAREIDHPIGAWGDETRHYLVSLDATAGRLSDPAMLAGRFSLVEGDVVRATATLKASWTSDTALSTQINDRVAHYTGQAELSYAIRDGLQARRDGDTETAARKLGRAAQLAAQTGHHDSLRMIAKVADIIDADGGVIRLKDAVAAVDEMSLDTYSTKTTPRSKRE